MGFLRRISATAVIGAGALACGGQEKQATTETTAAAAAANTELVNQTSRLERERDEARAALVDERTNREREAQEHASNVAVNREHDELEMRVLQAIDKAEMDLQALREKAPRAGAKQKPQIEKTITEAQQQKGKLLADLRLLHGELGTSWEAFRKDVEATISELDRVLLAAPSDMKEPAKGQPAKGQPQKGPPKASRPKDVP